DTSGRPHLTEREHPPGERINLRRASDLRGSARRLASRVPPR
ncbi:2706_t:CDS:1, partial [Paraglomus occultum]